MRGESLGPKLGPGLSWTSRGAHCSQLIAALLPAAFCSGMKFSQGGVDVRHNRTYVN